MPYINIQREINIILLRMTHILQIPLWSDPVHTCTRITSSTFGLLSDLPGKLKKRMKLGGNSLPELKLFLGLSTFTP